MLRYIVSCVHFYLTWLTQYPTFSIMILHVDYYLQGIYLNTLLFWLYMLLNNHQYWYVLLYKLTLALMLMENNLSFDSNY